MSLHRPVQPRAVLGIGLAEVADAPVDDLLAGHLREVPVSGLGCRALSPLMEGLRDRG